MRGKEMLYAMNDVKQSYIEETAWEPRAGGMRTPYLRCFTAAACLCLALLGALRLGTVPGGRPPVVEPPLPPAVSRPPAETLSPIQPPEPQTVAIHWEGVAVNESEGLGMDATRLYMDPALYTVEHWDMDQIRDYYGWELAPAYIPEDLTGGGVGVGHTIYRDKATGEIIEDQAGRGFWVDFYEDGSPRSDDDIVIPRGFTVTASKLGILHCGLLPVDGERTTDFGGTPVTLTHASLPYGPFDPTQRDPSGLYNKPAGYYDIYVASFEMDGVEYEVEAQRMELEEVVKIVASILEPYEDMTVGGE